MGALEGVQVVDLSQNLAGPYATQILADLGADVVKVEPPGGDPARSWGPPFVDGVSPLFLCSNRNKRSVVLDLKTEPGREALSRLVDRADVFAQSSRPGVVERFGFGALSVLADRPDLVYLSVTAFGGEGPLGGDPGYDPLMQARAGLMSVTGEPDGPPVRVGTSIVDLATGMWAAISVMAALTERRATGRGRHVTASLLDTAVGWMAYHLQGHDATGEVPDRAGSGIGMIVPYQAFDTHDGAVMIAAGNDAIFRRLCDGLGVPEVAADPRFETNADRVRNRAVLEGIVSEAVHGSTTAQIVERLRRVAVPCAPVQDVGDVAGDAQVLVSGMLRRPWGEGGPLDVAMPLRWNGARASAGRPPPGVGEHTEEVLREIGLG